MAAGPISLSPDEVEETPTLDASQVEESGLTKPQAVAGIESATRPQSAAPVAPSSARLNLGPSPRSIPEGLQTEQEERRAGAPLVITPQDKVQSVPRPNQSLARPQAPDSSLNYAVPGNEVTGGVTGFFPSRTPRNGPGGQLPATPPLEAAKATLGAIPPQSETELLPGAATELSAAQHLATPGQRVRGATEAVQGLGEAVTPLMGPEVSEIGAAGGAAVKNALRLGAGLGTGIGAQKAGEEISKALGASKDTQQLVSELSFWAPTILGMVGGNYEALPKDAAGRADAVFRNLVYKAGGTVPENATLEQATAAYKQAINNLHPDVSPATAQEAQILNAAWTAVKGRYKAGPPVAPPTRAELAEHLDRTHFESGDAARTSYVAEKQAQEAPVEAEPKAPEAEVIPPAKPSPAAPEVAKPIVLEANQVEEAPKPATVSPKESRAPQGAKPRAGGKPTAEPVSKPAAESAPVVAKPGVEETAATPSKEQPAEKPEIVKGGKVELPDGRRATIEYAAPADKLPVVRLSTEDGEKVKLTSQKEIDGLKAATKYKYGSTQADIPESSEAHSSLEAARARISDSDLAGKGKDVGGNHVTVRYGIQSEDVEGVKKYLASLAPFEASLGKTDKFPPSPNSDGAAVIHAPIESPELQKINTELEKHGDFTEPSFKEYRPHATVAYVDPAKAGRYTGMSVTEGKKFPVNEIAITDKNGGQTVVKLEGKKQPSNYPTPESRAASQAAFDEHYPPGTLPEKTLTGDALRAWQESIGNPLPKEEDPGAKVRAKNPEPTRAEVKAARIAPEPTHTDMERNRLGLPPEPGRVGEMNTRDLKVAPHKFQYKLSTDAEGVGTLLKETKVFNPDLAGVISVWKDPSDGKTYVVNGHHRYELAKRTGQKTVTIRHIVAKDATTARAIGALQNIAEGRGTAIDAAKFFRDSGLDPEQLKEKGISLGEKTASDGLAMSKLDPAIFQKVVSGDLRQGTAIAIGEGTSDPAQQAAILKQIDRMERKGQKVSDSRIREFIRLADQSEKRTEETTSLFGTEQVERSLLWEKSAVSEYVQDQLKKDKRLFGFVAKEGRAEELARAGNKIDVEKSKEISTGAAQAEEVYNKLSARGGPIASILDEAARKLADGESAGQVKSDAYQRIRAEVSKTLQGSTGTGAERSEGAPESPEAKGQEASIDLFSGAEPYKAPIFYSKAARVAFEKLPSSMSGDSALATLKNAGVKADEIKWIGLDDLLAGKPKVSKQDVLSHIMRNMVQIKEVTKGQRSQEQQRAVDQAKDKREDAEDEFVNQMASVMMGSGVEPEPREARRAAQLAAAEIRDGIYSEGVIRNYLGKNAPSETLLRAGADLSNASFNLRQARKENQTPTKYESYTLPGDKTNYTELLLTLPQPKQSPEWQRVHDEREKVEKEISAWVKGDNPDNPNGTADAFGTPEYEAAKKHYDDMQSRFVTLDAKLRTLDKSRANFTTSHFDEPNILAHVRFDDRTDADGKRVLFVEEVQSDWHQKGKKVGYSEPPQFTPEEQELRMLNSKTWHGNYNWTAEETARAKELQAKVGVSIQEKVNRANRGVPDAPFKSDWHELAMKRMLRAAAENGYDKLAWVTGEQTADRYDLSKQVSSIGYSGTNLKVFDKQGHEVVSRTGVRPEDLPGIIGKEAAQKLMDKKPEGTLRTIDGLDLKVGGEWAKNLYDRAIPNFISKVGKKWGAKPGKTEIETGSKTDRVYRGPNATEEYLFDLSRQRSNFPDMPDPVGDQAEQVAIGMQNGMSFADAMDSYAGPELVEELGGRLELGKSKTVPVHSIDVTPEMKKSLVEDGQPLFSSFFPSFPPSVAKDIQFSKVETKPGVSPYIRVNPEAVQAISRSLGINFLGVNLDGPSVDKVSAALRTAADTAEMNADDTHIPARETTAVQKAVRQLRGFADALDEAIDQNPKHGVSLVRAGEGEVKTAHEELLHSVQRKGGEGYLPSGVPWKQALQDTGMARMAAERIVPQLSRAGISPHPAVVVAEGIVDIMRGDAADDLSPLEAQNAAEKYFEAALQQHGIEHLQDFKAVQDYIAEREEALDAEGKYRELAIGRKEHAIRSAGEAALARVLSRATGAANGPGGAELQSASNQGEGSARSGSGETGLSPQDNAGLGRKRPASTAKEPIFSTQPIGLTDEELEQWAKSKGFRYEPAGEQLGMFGGNDQLLRVFRQGPRGREQRGLVYQNQLDRLQETQATAPTEPFSLTGGEEREEQPRLFGAGDLGEIIGNPQAEKPKLPAKQSDDFSLFTGARVVPGARSSKTGNETGKTSIQDLTDSISRQVPEKRPLKDRISRGADIGEKTGDAKDSLGRAYDRIKGAASALWDAYHRPPKWTDYEDLTGKWSGADQINALDLDRFSKAIVRAVPEKLRREAISNWIEAGGDEAVLRDRAGKSKSPYKKGYEAALHLSDAETTIARNIMNRNDATLEEAQKAGILQQGVENYVRHVYADSPKYQAKVAAEMNFASLQTKPSFTKERKLPTYFDAEQLGFTPKDKDVGYLTAIHERSFREALAARAYVHALMHGKATDGRPLVATSWASAKELSPRDGEASAAYLIKPNVKAEEEFGDYRKLDHPALRGWRWAGKTSEGAPIFVQGDAIVHPEIFRNLKNNLTKSAIRSYETEILGHTVHPGAFVLNASAEIKHAILSFSGFHQTTLAAHAAEHRTLPAGMPELNLNEPKQRKLVEHGLMVAQYDAEEAFGEGVASGGLVTKIPGIGPLYHHYTQYLFHSFLPRIKMGTSLNALDRNFSRYKGKLSEDQIYAITAAQGNASFGGLNYRMLGRNKTIQDVLRLGLMAPDFFEARARYAGQAAKPYGREQLVALIGGGLVIYALLRILNEITDRDSHWDKPFSVVYRDKEYTMRLIQEDIFRAVTDPGKYLMNRLSPVVSTAIHLGEGRNEFGRKESVGEIIKQTAKREVPIPLQPWTRESKDTNAQKAVETIAKMVGVNMKNAHEASEERLREKERAGRETEKELEDAAKAGDTATVEKIENDPEKLRLISEHETWAGYLSELRKLDSEIKDVKLASGISREDRRAYLDSLRDARKELLRQADEAAKQK